MRRIRTRLRRHRVIVGLVALLLLAGVAIAPSAIAGWRRQPAERRDITNLEVRSLDGSGNNRAHPEWGKAGQPYLRVARTNYADGISVPVAGPNVRLVSNRLFNDTNQNIFSERAVTQWGWTWGQFLDHTFGLRDETGPAANIVFNADDPMEAFENDLGAIPFARSGVAEGTGAGTRRTAQQTNTESSYVDATAVYGDSLERLEWLRAGPVDGDMSNNSALLLMPDEMLPRRDARGDAASAPEMGVDGRLLGQPARAAVAGDVRANENIALLATQTLFAREHNRIVGLLPNWLTNEQKFQIARRVVIAEQQYITYREFLPAMGVKLSPYRGYNPRVDATLGNEFATVGYRAHSQIHGEFEIEVDGDRFTAAELEAFEEQGLEVEVSEDGEEVAIGMPLNVAFFNPDLLEDLSLDAMLKAIGGESQYDNDGMIDNQLRSVLFQLPSSDNPECLDGEELPECFKGVVDLGAIDIERGRDHGMPTYNQLRRAFGLPPKFSFKDITGESTEAFPRDPELTPGDEINDPDSLDFIELFDRDGNPLEVGSEEAVENAVRGVRRTTIAARLKAVYRDVNRLDAFTGLISEEHVPGTEFGELQLAMWKQQFQALRDGDRFFFQNDPGLDLIKRRLGIDFRHSLGDLIALNTDTPRDELADNVFFVAEEETDTPEPTPTATSGDDDDDRDSPPATTTATTPSRSRRRRH